MQSDSVKGKSPQHGPAKWSLGVLNDRRTLEVPGSVLLLSRNFNEPLGLRLQPARTSHSSIPAHPALSLQGAPGRTVPQATIESHAVKKTTRDGKIILDPQPEDSANDPLNWPAWRRDCALLSLGLISMVGGGMTPVLAAGFTNVAADYHVSVTHVSLTTGLYMLGLGLGSVVFSPTAILFGKRPVWLFSSILFVLSSVWCALSPNFTSLILARIFQGISVSPVECLPSATIAEIFFLHERAFRIGIYTLLLLGGKNLVPLISAAVIQAMGWRWVFWVVAMFVAFCGVLLFLFVPETFWDRSPVPRKRKSSAHQGSSFLQRLSRLDSHNLLTFLHGQGAADPQSAKPSPADGHRDSMEMDRGNAPASPTRRYKDTHVGFAPALMQDPHSTSSAQQERVTPTERSSVDGSSPAASTRGIRSVPDVTASPWNAENSPHKDKHAAPLPTANQSRDIEPTNQLNKSLSERRPAGWVAATSSTPTIVAQSGATDPEPLREVELGAGITFDSNVETVTETADRSPSPRVHTYTHARRQRPALTFLQQLKPYNGRLNKDQWLKVAIRPFILFSYPAILWSAAVYALSVGWLIVVSESVAIIFRNADSYNFNALQTGLVYVSPFLGGILGTVVAGKVSDIVVKAMARRNGGLYEPEFRLVMAIPVALTTAIGLMGFGWSAQERDAWIVPTVFLGLLSFGCTLGSTTSITFCVDSYRQYAGEALVTLNFSKNVLHGFVFSLFVTDWLTADGAKSVFVWIGIIHLLVLLTSIPMFVFGKRARMWTVRRNFVERATSGFREIKF